MVSGLWAAAQEVPQIANVMARQTTSLNGEWNYIVDVQEEGYYDYRMNPMRSGFFVNAKPQRPEDLIEYDFDKNPTLKVPGDWNTQDDRLFFYEGTVWYKKSFEYHPQAGKRTLLYFGAVNYDAHVYVNGQKAGHHQGGFTPFNYDVTDFMKDGENVVIVKVDNKRHAEDVPTQIFDWWNYGGITRDVCLVTVEPTYVENYKLQLKSLEGRLVNFSVKLNREEAGRLVTLSIPELKIKKTLTTAADGTASISMKAKPQLWSPENPKLYKVEIKLGEETICDEIGFRTIETKGKQILLNGQPIFLKGSAFMRKSPTAVDAPTLRKMRIRSCHGPRNWAVTSYAWLTIPIMSMLFVKLSAWVCSYGRRFPATGRLPGQTQTPMPMQSVS